MNRRRFLARAAVVPVALAAVAVGVKTPKPEPKVSIDLGVAVPQDGQWHTMRVDVNNRGGGVFYIDGIEVAPRRNRVTWQDVAAGARPYQEYA